jgi:hypothetical protein
MGQGVPQDHAEAAKWFRRAADQGLAGGQFNLGVLYGNGQGVPKDFVQAYLWFSLAAKQGFGNAARFLDVAKNDMSEAQKKEAAHLVDKWTPKKERP